jgi:uncharacterized membrane protein YhaH (DUF805 family)
MTGLWFWPRGRASRRAFALLYLLPALLTFFVVYLISRSEPDLGAVQAIWLVARWTWAWPLAVGLAKRLHDSGHSGLWVLTVLVPVVGIVPFVLIALVFPGQSKTNKYGAPPFDLVGAR